jgi:hypothetical protein
VVGAIQPFRKTYLRKPLKSSLFFRKSVNSNFRSFLDLFRVKTGCKNEGGTNIYRFPLQVEKDQDKGVLSKQTRVTVKGSPLLLSETSIEKNSLSVAIETEVILLQ